MRAIKLRISRLEAKWPPMPELEAGQMYFEAAVSVQEATFTEEDRHLPREQVESMALVDHFAWLRRFEGEADLERVMALYGFDTPETGEAFIMATTIIHGDASL